MQIKILSWNIWCDGDFKQISDFLRASKADIIGLQEVVPGDKSRDVVSFLKILGYEHAVAPIGSVFSDGRMITSAIFSKYPIRASKMHMLSEESPRQAVEVSIKIKSATLKVFSLHTKHTHQKESDIQNLQVENLIKVLPKEKVVVVGDFNATPNMKPIKRLREILVDTDLKSLPTVNADLFDCDVCDSKQTASTRLDYIFASEDLKIHSPKVESGIGSDHFPISVMIEI